MSEELTAEDLLARVAQRDIAALGELYDRYASRLYGLMTRILSSGEGAEEALQEIFLRLWRESPSLSQEGRSVGAWLVVRSREIALERLRALRKNVPSPVPPRGLPAQAGPDPFTIPVRQVRATGLRPIRRVTDFGPQAGGGPSGARQSPGPPTSAECNGKKSGGRAHKTPVTITIPPAWLPSAREVALIDKRQGLLQKVIGQLPKSQRQALERAVFEGLTESEIAEQIGEPLGKVRTALRAAVIFVRHRRRAVCGTWVANI